MSRGAPKARGNRDASRRYHDRVARQYDSIYDDAYWDFHDDLTWRSVKPHLPRDANARCCDLGCGTGKWGLKLLKSGYPTVFLDHAAAMIEQARQKIDAMGNRAARATLLVADIVDLQAIESESISLSLAMGDPLSICSDPQRAAREMRRITAPGGIVIASADNKLAALDHYAAKADLDGLEQLVHTGRTHWLTADERERFDLTTFTPASLRRLFEQAGMEVLSIIGKPILPIRQHPQLLASDNATRRLLALEAELSRDPAAAARAAHLQITARRPTTDVASMGPVDSRAPAPMPSPGTPPVPSPGTAPVPSPGTPPVPSPGTAPVPSPGTPGEG